MSNRKSLLITLGHNSSVIFLLGGKKPIGYEEERLTGKKSDSSYPKRAITRIMNELTDEDLMNADVYISHWFDVFDIELFPEKYFDHDHFLTLTKRYNMTVYSLSALFTHHDAHAYSSKAFYENFEPTPEYMHYIVMDGFGNNQEVLSIYNNRMECIHKITGFENSLGLMYQYATSYVGMKENQDEYKFLGYEAHIKDVLSDDGIEALNILAYEHSMAYMNIGVSQYKYHSDYLDLNALAKAKHAIQHDYIEYVVKILDSNSAEFNRFDEFQVRVVVGYLVQATLEKCILRLINKFAIRNVALSGGCFYNVKLNKFILDNVKGKVSVIPLAGDQGAAIGLYSFITGEPFPFGDLCYGKRSLSAFNNERDAYVVNSKEEAAEVLADALNHDMIINFVTGGMEFGPRALCNTSTLANPTAENGEYINMVNDRNEVMPMAPAIAKSFARGMLNTDDINRVVGSNKFMIMTHDFNPVAMQFYRGVMHNKPTVDGYTCRPQIVEDDSVMGILLNNCRGCLINTSFNVHGKPIAYSVSDVLDNFYAQKRRDINHRIILVVYVQEDNY